MRDRNAELKTKNSQSESASDAKAVSGRMQSSQKQPVGKLTHNLTKQGNLVSKDERSDSQVAKATSVPLSTLVLHVYV